MVEVGANVYYIPFSKSINCSAPYFKDYVGSNKINAIEIQSFMQHRIIPTVIMWNIEPLSAIY